MPELTIEQALQLAVAHHQAGRLADAEAVYQKILSAQPNYPDALHMLGVIAGQTGRHEQAVDLIHQAIAAAPGNPNYYYHLGLLLHRHGEVDEAIACYQQALKIKPEFSEAHYNLGNAWKEKGESEKSLTCYQRAVEHKPDHWQARNNLGGALWEKGQVDQAVACYRKAWELNPNFISAHDNFLYALLFHPDSTPRSLLAENQRWNLQHAQRFQQLIQPHLNDRDPERRLRVGYVSPDFRRHPVGRCLLPVLQHHDSNCVEVVCYSSTVKPDRLTPRFKECAALWRDVQGLSDEQLAAQIRDDRVDILVDLTLHMAGNRLLVFARKPAPVQATWLGYPGTTGLETMDYRLTDPYMDPPGEGNEFYTEKSIRLPDTFQVYDPLTAEIPVNPLPAAEVGYVTLGCLNNFAKFNEPLLETWARILHQSPGTRLLLKTNEESSMQWVREIFARHGILPDRIEFSGDQPSHEAYLMQYQRIDLVLDPFPYNGHTTSMDAIWMGVPVLNWCGKTAVSRAGLSQSSNLGLPELTVMSQVDYIRMAVELANDLPRLAELRRTLRPRMEASPLMDAARFARGIEDAYRTMWRNWCGNK